MRVGDERFWALGRCENLLRRRGASAPSIPAESTKK